MQDFVYHRPLTLDAALGTLAALSARVLAGGTDLVPQLREGRRSAADVVDVKRIAGLGQITAHVDGSVSIGATASARTIAAHTSIMEAFPAIAAACRLIGSWQIQNRASLGGNVCNAAPSADGIPPLICHGAIAQVVSKGGRREIPVEALFTGPGRTKLEPGELLAALHLPAPAQRTAAAYLRFTPRREMDIAIAGVGTLIQLGADGRIASARIALASVAPTPIRAPAAEQSLIGELPTLTACRAAGAHAALASRPISDTRGSADYRRHLVAVLTRRALAACIGRLNIPT